MHILHAGTGWILALMCIMAGCRGNEGASPSEGRRPAPAARGLDEAGRLQAGPEDRCPVCAMPIRDHAKFASAIETGDGRTYYFCGTGCMLRSWLHPEVYLDAPRTDLRRAMTRDYFMGEPLDASQAVFIAGSDVMGPMGPALVPLRNDEDLRIFQERHGGTARFRLGELDDARWEQVTGRKAVLDASAAR